MQLGVIVDPSVSAQKSVGESQELVGTRPSQSPLLAAIPILKSANFSVCNDNVILCSYYSSVILLVGMHFIVNLSFMFSLTGLKSFTVSS